MRKDSFSILSFEGREQEMVLQVAAVQQPPQADADSRIISFNRTFSSFSRSLFTFFFYMGGVVTRESKPLNRKSQQKGVKGHTKRRLQTRLLLNKKGRSRGQGKEEDAKHKNKNKLNMK